MHNLLLNLHLIQHLGSCLFSTAKTRFLIRVYMMADAIKVVNFFQVAKKTAQKSKTILTDIERWQKV